MPTLSSSKISPVDDRSDRTSMSDSNNQRGYPTYVQSSSLRRGARPLPVPRTPSVASDLLDSASADDFDARSEDRSTAAGDDVEGRLNRPNGGGSYSQSVLPRRPSGSSSVSQSPRQSLRAPESPTLSTRSGPIQPMHRATSLVYSYAEGYVYPIPRPTVAEECFRLHKHAPRTQERMRETLSRLVNEGRHTLTMLLLGRSGVGKSSTINNFFGEDVCEVNAYEPGTMKSMQTSRHAHPDGVTIRMIDTPGFLDVRNSQIRNVQHTENIRYMVRDKQIDCVLYVDRLDHKRVDAADRTVIKNITEMLGKVVWKHTMLVLTHGQMYPPDDMQWSEYVVGRVRVLTEAIRKAAGPMADDAPLPVVIVENSKECDKNADDEFVLPDGTVWIANLLDQAAEFAIKNTEFRYRKTEEEKGDWPWMAGLVAAGAFFVGSNSLHHAKCSIQ